VGSEKGKEGTWVSLLTWFSLIGYPRKGLSKAYSFWEKKGLSACCSNEK